VNAPTQARATRSAVVLEIKRLLIELRECNRDSDLNGIHFGKVLGAITVACAAEAITQAESTRLFQLSSNAVDQSRNELFSSRRAIRHAA